MSQDFARRKAFSGHPKFSIITPCFNSESVILETVQSVLEQTVFIRDLASLEYIVCDGKSKDQTVQLIESIQDPRVQMISKPDNGMYEALAHGFSLASGDIVAYINAGDYYHKCAFEMVLEIFAKQEVSWVTGLNVLYNEKSYPLEFSLPFKYRRQFIQKGIYGTYLPFIQQESTFWKKDLMRLVDLERLSSYRLAGDYYLWHQFAKEAELYIVRAYLGGFKKHGNQLSADGASYLREFMNIAQGRISWRDRLTIFSDKISWRFPDNLKKRLNPQFLFMYDYARDRFC